MTDLADQEARDRIAQVHDRTLFVEAGAGSGKTSSLVSRLVTLVVEGADVTSIAAITFTEAAAAELRARVRQALEQVELGQPVPHVDDTETGRSRARIALERLDRATICTLHAFAQRLLLGTPVEAGLPPRIDVHDDISSALRFEERWARFERSLLDDESLEELLRTALALGVNSRHLQTVAAMLAQNWDLVEEAQHSGLLAHDLAVDVDLSAIPVDDWIAEWTALVDEGARCLAGDDKLLRWIEDVAGGVLAWLRRNRTEPYVLIGVADMKIPSPGGKGSRDNWPAGFKDEFVPRARAAIDAFVADVGGITDAVLTRLGAEIARYTLDDAEARRREGRLEFHDLLVLARQVLRSQPEVRRRYHRRYAHLLIDEFQDTDPLQIELAVRIAADPEHDTSVPWHEVEVEEGRLFFVGDPKQSIYRFRRADIDLFTRTAERYAGGYTSLNVNFRTTEPVLAFCNAVFERMISRVEEPVGAGMTRIAQPDYVPLATSRTALDGDPGPPVVVLGDGAPHANAEAARLAEAADVAAVLQRAREEQWSVAPGGEPRPCRWSDMAVLLPSRSTLSHLRTALDEAEIPYRLESGTLVYGTTEITDLTSILRAIDDPGDSIAIVGALRSPAYGCGDDDLHRWVRVHGRCTYLGATVRDEGDVAAGESRDVVEAALADLRARHRTAPFRSVPEIVESVTRDRRLMESSLAGGRHRDVWRLYRVVLEHARQFADTEPGGLRAFLHWVGLQRDDKVRATSPVIPEADVDAVRILTIHGSKGLEFGITTVSGLSARDPTGLRGATVQFRPGGGFDVRMKSGMETTRFEVVRSVEETMDLHERTRLLYVALTRARDHLVVSSHHTERAREKSHGGRLTEHLDDLGDDLEELVERWTNVTDESCDGSGVADESSRPVGDGEAVVDDAPPDEIAAWEERIAGWAAGRRTLRDVSGTGGVVSATAVARHLTTLDEAEQDHAVPEREPWRRGRAGTAVGSAVHAVLQHTDLTDQTGSDLSGLAAWQAGVEGIADRAALIEQKARAASSSPVVRRAVASGRWRREVHVAVPLVEVIDSNGAGPVDLFEGFVDLLFDEDDGTVVVDYKTDEVPSDVAVAAALERYTPQGAAYALAVEAATRRPVTEVHFLFLRGGDAVDVEVPDLGAAKARVRDALATYGVSADRDTTGAVT
ncbi:MAG: UvrD-helicase domain-containing protein [Acidimicrobiales bacterium]|nr:UvrD-helicase domain-containing protein [Acidimicrobiales bacterium]